MQTISVKIDEDVYQELEKRRGNEIKSVYYCKQVDADLSYAYTRIYKGIIMESIRGVT